MVKDVFGAITNAAVSIAMLACCVTGCSTTGGTDPLGAKRAGQQASLTQPIDVQDCTVISFSVPTKYICPDGKTYTSHQLAKLRAESQNPPRK